MKQSSLLLDTHRPASTFGRVLRFSAGVGLFGLGGWVLFTVSAFGLILSLLGLAVASLGIFPDRIAKVEDRDSQSLAERRSSSITAFRILFVGTVFVLVEVLFLRNLLIIILSWVPVAVWIFREVKKMVPVRS